ncbi:hypothetical protein [Actinoplanes sp. NPDC020271]|uniref:hypothetical protein n=1 Tax=Actinoplanes sp. NPDC020271 TaxID=3363896 RepID=UPI0037AA16C7
MTVYTWENLAEGVAALRAAVLVVEKIFDKNGDADFVDRARSEHAIDAMMVEIPRMFEPFYSVPGPRAFDAVLTDLLLASSKLAMGQGEVAPADGLQPSAGNLSLAATVSTSLADWSGVAATTFRRDYLDKLPAQAANACTAVKYMRAVVEAEDQFWAKIRNDIAQILNDAIDAVTNMRSSCDKNSLTTMLTAVAATAAVVGTFPISATALALGTAECLLATTMATVDGAASVGATLLPDDPPKTRFSANTLLEVITAVQKAIGVLIGKIQEHDNGMNLLVGLSTAVVEQERTSFVPPMPALADATRTTITDRAFMGIPN